MTTSLSDVKPENKLKSQPLKIMNTAIAKIHRLRRRAQRTRSKLRGTAERPRLTVSRSLKHISVQLIDDTHSLSLIGVGDQAYSGSKSDKAKAVGKAIAEAAQKMNITSVVFDRGSYLYHGRVKALADAARDQGLKF